MTISHHRAAPARFIAAGYSSLIPCTPRRFFCPFFRATACDARRYIPASAPLAVLMCVARWL